MTSHTGKRRALAISAVAAAVISATGAPLALADPASPITPGPPSTTPGAPPPPDAPAPMTADQELAMIDKDYDTGAGGGQVSNLIHQVMQLRAKGFKPSNANRDAIAAALDQRPNEEPLIAALQATLVYQRKLAARQQNAKAPQQGVLPVAPDQLPPGVPPQQPGGINIPIPVG